MKYSQILSIKKIDKPQNTYNLHIENNHNYFANNLNVSNCHTVRGDALQNIINNATNASWKVGVTGTVPRNRVEKLQLLGTLGRVYKVITPQGLIDRGLATPVFINLIYLVYNQIDKDYIKQQKMKYPDEEKFIASHIPRNLKVASLMHKLTRKNGGENILALFTKVDHGKLLLENAIANKTGNRDFKLLDKFTPKPLKEAMQYWSEVGGTSYINQEISEKDKEKILKNARKEFDESDSQGFLASIKSLKDLDIYFIYGGVDGSAREEIRKVLEEKTGVQIIASYGTTSTGVNYKNLHHLVLTSSTKSFIRLSQTVGRGMRKHDSKSAVHIWDVIDDITYETARSKKENYALKHSYERIEIYRENGYPLTEKEIFL